MKGKKTPQLSHLKYICYQSLEELLNVEITNIYYSLIEFDLVLVEFLFYLDYASFYLHFFFVFKTQLILTFRSLPKIYVFAGVVKLLILSKIEINQICLCHLIYFYA